MRRTPLRRKSKKRERQERDYAVWRRGYLARHPNCMLRWSTHCSGRSAEVHHVLKRSQGAPLIPKDEADVLATCWPCHFKVDVEPAEAKERGFVRKAR